MDFVRRRPAVSASAAIMAVVWGEVYILTRGDDATRRRLFRYQMVVIIEVILAFLNAVMLNWSLRAPALRAIRSTRLLVLLHFYRASVVLLSFMAQISFFTMLLPQAPDPRPFVYASWCAFGIAAQYLFCAGLLSFLWLVYRLFLKFFRSSSPSTPSLFGVDFRDFRAAVSFVYAVVISAACIYGGLQLPTVKEVEISISRLPHSLSGLVIAQLSDIHLGPTSGLTRLRGIVDLTNQLDPDVVVVNGDLVDGDVQHLGPAVAELGRLRSKRGVFFVTGNHEYISGGVDDLLDFLDRHGVRSLHNSNVKIFGSKAEDFLWLAGTDDIFADKIGYEGHGFRLASALNRTDDSHPRILLAHQPKAALAALKSQFRLDLILSGHTHGGQFIPYNVLLWFGNPFFKGLYRNLGAKKDSQVYVTEGSVFWGSPFRLGSTMEISKIVLKP